MWQSSGHVQSTSDMGVPVIYADCLLYSLPGVKGMVTSANSYERIAGEDGL